MLIYYVHRAHKICCWKATDLAQSVIIINYLFFFYYLRPYNSNCTKTDVWPNAMLRQNYKAIGDQLLGIAYGFKQTAIPYNKETNTNVDNIFYSCICFY